MIKFCVYSDNVWREAGRDGRRVGRGADRRRADTRTAADRWRDARLHERYQREIAQGLYYLRTNRIAPSISVYARRLIKRFYCFTKHQWKHSLNVWQGFKTICHVT